jgi:predicted transposase YdaD
MIQRDTLWKSLIEDIFPDLLVFAFPEWSKQVDLAKKPEFLDTELSAIRPGSGTQDRIADKLIKIWTTSGQEVWCLLHLEIQGYDDPQFAARMHEYFYRIRDKYQVPVTALVIYTNSNPAHQPKAYHYNFVGTELIYRFNTFHLAEQTPETLRASRNAFGFALEIALTDLNVGGGKFRDQELYQRKKEMIRAYLESGLKKEKLRKLFDFMKAYTPFRNSDLELTFEQDLRSFSNIEEVMGITETILHEVEKKGIEKGIEKGLKIGEKKGEKRGKKKGFTEAIRLIVIRGRLNGMEISELAQLTGFSEQEVSKILQSENGAGR